MAVGSVKFFNEAKGYGFIEQDGDRGDVFVHISDVEKAGFDTLAKGQKVAFDIASAKRGDKAVNLRPPE